MKTPDETIILHIEDNPENRLLVRRLLTSKGFKAIDAENASQAMDFVSKQTPHLILMDINMPGVDGYTLTSYFRTNPALLHVPIIAITANVMKGDRERTLEAGCDGYIEKPIDVDTFLDQVAYFLSMASQPYQGMDY
jgi:two-component system cell cycle response regulator DivK